MRPRDRNSYLHIETALKAFHQTQHALPGIKDAKAQNALIEQILESIHRIDYVLAISKRNIAPQRADPSSDMFDPLKGAILHLNAGDDDEAFWLIFLFVHFGKNRRGGWRYARDVYGRLGNGKLWNWNRISSGPDQFRKWLEINCATISRKQPAGGFGNHRKYESLDAYSPTGTGAVVKSYIEWVGPSRRHKNLIKKAIMDSDGTPGGTFNNLYESMTSVIRFGRTARFDYLCMIGKLGLAAIEPRSAYLHLATGPLHGARLLFGGTSNAPIAPAKLDSWTLELGDALKLGMQVLEDSLCNWQKSPKQFTRFRG